MTLDEFYDEIISEYNFIDIHLLRFHIEDMVEINEDDDEFKYTANLIITDTITESEYSYQIGYRKLDNNLYIINDNDGTHPFDSKELMRHLIIDLLICQRD